MGCKHQSDDLMLPKASVKADSCVINLKKKKSHQLDIWPHCSDHVVTITVVTLTFSVIVAPPPLPCFLRILTDPATLLNLLTNKQTSAKPSYIVGLFQDDNSRKKHNFGTLQTYVTSQLEAQPELANFDLFPISSQASCTHARTHFNQPPSIFSPSSRAS